MNCISINKERIYYIPILIFLLFVYEGVAQKSNISTIANVKWGKVNQAASKGDGSMKGFIGVDDEMFYTYRVKQIKLLPPVITIENYTTTNHEKVISYSVDFRRERKGESFEGFVYFQNRIYLLTAKEENDQRYLLAEIVNKKTLIPSGEITRLGKLPPLASLKNDLSVHEQIAYIKEKNEKLVVVTNSVIGGHNMKKFVITVYDEKLGRLWTKLVDIPHKGRNWRIMEIDFDQEGNVYILGKRVKITDDDKSSQLELKAYLEEGKLVREFSVKELCETIYRDGETEDVCLSAKLVAYDKNNIVVTGLLGKEGQKRDKGFFFYRYNPVFFEREVKKDIYFEELERRENRDFLGKQGTIPNYLLMDAIPQADGGVIIIGEQRKSEDRGKKSQGLNMKNSGIIIVMRVSKEGELIWLKYVCKHQVGINATFDSYIFLQREGSINFIFNDHVQNYTVLDCKNCRKHKFTEADLEPIMVEVDFDGNMKKHILYDESTEDYGYVNLGQEMTTFGNKTLLLFFEMPKKLPTSKKVEYFLQLNFK